MMKQLFKTYILPLLVIACLWGITLAKTPSFDDNFANYLTDSSTPDQYGRVESVFSLCIDRNATLMENIKNLFYPNQSRTFVCKDQKNQSQTSGGQIWDLIRVVSFGLLVLFLIIAGISFVMNGSSADGPKKAGMSIVYMWYGAFLVFGSIWILGYVLNIENVQGTADLVNKVQNDLFLQILTFFKVLAFFFAIVMMAVSGFKIMSAMDKEDKIKEGRKGLINIILGLVFIKIIDYVFYIAQVPDFAQKASALVVDIAKILGWAIGLVSVLAIFYGGYQLFVAGGDEKAFKKTKGIIVNILIASMVLFFFLLIIYQIFNEFVGK